MLSPDPDNAALLYYQAALSYPETDTATDLALGRVLRGDDPNDKVREHLHKCRDTLRLMETGTQIPQCTWGILYSQGDNLLGILPRLRQLALLLEVDARVCAVDGDYRSALDKILSLRRFAAHTAEETLVAYLSALQFDYCLRSIQRVLGVMPPDKDTLLWLQAQLGTVQGPLPSPGRAIERELEYALHPAGIEIWRKRLAEAGGNEALLALTEPEVVQQAGELAGKFAATAQRIIGGGGSYAQKHAELSHLVEEARQNNDAAMHLLLWRSLIIAAPTHFDLYVRHLARFRAVCAAIEIYLQTADTGQLPTTLPEHLPQDPFSGQDFEYQITDGGFILRCRAEEISEHRVWEYEFRVPQ